MRSRFVFAILVSCVACSSFAQSQSPQNYLADNVVLFRFFEAAGWVRRALSVVKKRNGHHERTIRELDFDARGISIGEPLSDFHGILTGVPTYVGRDGSLMGKK